MKSVRRSDNGRGSDVCSEKQAVPETGRGGCGEREGPSARSEWRFMQGPRSKVDGPLERSLDVTGNGVSLFVADRARLVCGVFLSSAKRGITHARL